MSESYVECMVARKTPAGLLFAKYLLIILTGVAFFASFVFGNLLFFAAIGLGIAAYFVGIYIDVEFEGLKVMATKKYDYLLRYYYNDYMQLPPLEKRVPKHEFSAYIVE